MRGVSARASGFASKVRHWPVTSQVKAGMLHVWSTSGQELAAMSMEELSDVGTLKQHLRQQRGYPVCVQRLLHEGSFLDDADKLDALSSALDVQLVLLPVRSSEAQSEQLADELTATAAHGHIDTTRSLLEAGVEVDLFDSSGATALHRAADHGRTQMVQFLLERGADKDRVDMYGNTALIRASHQARIETASLLLEAGADKDFANIAGVTALSVASDRGHVGMVRRLLAAGADRNLANRRSETALSLACSKGHVQVVRLLLGHLGHVAYKDALCRCPVAALSRAADNGHIVALLLGLGADKGLVRSHGHTALSLAAKKGHEAIMHLLSKTASAGSFTSETAAFPNSVE